MNKWNSSKADFLAGIILVFGGSPEFSGTCPRQSTPLQPHQASSFAVTFQPSKKVEANGRLGAVGIKRWTWKSPVFEKENHLNKLSKPLGFHVNLQGVFPQTPSLYWLTTCEVFKPGKGDEGQTLDKHPIFSGSIRNFKGVCFICRDSIVPTKWFSIWESSEELHINPPISLGF